MYSEAAKSSLGLSQCHGHLRACWTDQLCNDTGSVPANLWSLETGHSTGPWWSEATAQAGYAMTTTTT